MEHLHILDGHGYIYRAYYGMSGGGHDPNLKTQQGLPTNAIYTFAQMLIRVYLDRRPERMVVVFDAPGRTFRKDLDENYKATRRETPEDLKPQLPYFAQICEALSWPVVTHTGVEADDVIATLATLARARDWKVTIFSGDKDLMQLVDEHITLYEPMRQLTYDPPRVEKKFKVPPAQLRDYLAMVGDSSDNVPGMPGVGAKTAAKLLGEHGSLAAILDHKDTIKGKLGERFHDPALLEQLELSRQLVTLKRDVPVDVTLDQLVLQPWDKQRLDELFTTLEFAAPLERLHREIPALHDPDQADAANNDSDAAKSTASASQKAATKKTAANKAATEKTATKKAATKKAATKKAAAEPAAAPKPLDIPDPIVALDDSALAPVLAAAKRAGRIAIAIETDGQRPDRALLIGLGLAAAGEAPVYLPLRHRYLGAPEPWSEIPAALAALCADPAVRIVAHDIKSLRRALTREGVTVAGVSDDTMLSAYLLDAQDEPAIEKLAAAVEVTIPTRAALVGKGRAKIPFEAVPVEAAAGRAGRVANAALGIAPSLRERVAAADMTALLDDLELPLAVLLAHIESHGITVDLPYLRQLSDELGGHIADIERQAHDLVGESFNLGSPKQLSNILFDKLGLKSERMRKTKTGSYSTNHEVLEAMIEEHPVIALIMEHRELSKLKGTYLDALPPLVNPDTQRIHTSFNQAVAATGRLSSQDPNLQNIPIRKQIGRRIRRSFIAAEGKTLLSVDYSQIELRILAHLSRDPVLLGAFNEGIDVHTQTAAEVFDMPRDQIGPDERRVAKAVNYGLMYGQSAFGLAQSLGISRSQAQHYMRRYFERFDTIEAFMQRAVDDAREAGYTYTLLGRRRPLPDLNHSNFQRRKSAERMAQNAPVQGTAADIIKLAMLRVSARMERERFDAKMLLTVHDELVFELPPDQAEDFAAVVVEEMESAYNLDVPLSAEAGIAESWADAH